MPKAALADHEKGLSEEPKSKSKVAKEDSDAGKEDQEEGSGGEVEAEEEEYEIEAILDAKRGAFPGGRIGYLVKWKGYGEDQNSWVDEKDAGNADGLIEAYWRKNKKAQKGAKSVEPKPKSGRPRKSGAPAEDSDRESSTAPKKRGRKSKTKGDSDVEMEDEEQENKPKKKPRKSNGSKASKNVLLEDDEQDDEFGNMKKWMNTSSWEHIVQSIDTVERSEGDSLYVYFTLTDGARIKENSALCAERFPQKLIKFYESNLRWKATDTEAE